MKPHLVLSALSIFCTMHGILLSATAQSANNALEDELITICADPYTYPASVATYPPGYDIEIIDAIAGSGGYRTNEVWVDTGTRGGLSRALRQSIVQGLCDVFTGVLVDEKRVEELKRLDLVFTRPYLSLAFVPVVQGAVVDATSFSDLKDTAIGVDIRTPVDRYLVNKGYLREEYAGNVLLMDAVILGNVDAAIVWSPSIAVARKNFPSSEFKLIPEYVPEPELMWNIAMVVLKDENELKDFFNNALHILLENGKLRQIVESYGAPYFPPSGGSTNGNYRPKE